MSETRGITIEFYGKDLNLQNSIKDINNGLKATKTQLTDFKNQLKVDPKNLDALKGKFRMLQQEEKLLQEKAEYFRKELSKLDETEIGGEKWNSYDKQLKNTEKQILSVKNQLEKMGDVESMTEVTTEAEKMGDSFKEASDGALKFGDVLKANVVGDLIINGIKTIANELKQLGSELHQWANDYRQMEVYEKQFESNLKNTADASDEQIASLKKLAKQKQKTGVISAKSITSAYQELATYVESAEAVEGLTDALTDMAAQQYGVDATEESVRNLATTLGKALANGDYSGLTRLGYGFSDAQKKIMEYGTELQRVSVLNDVIESSIGGVNEALTQTDAGKVFQMKTYFDDIKESIGGVASELEIAFAEDLMSDLKDKIETVVNYIIENKDAIAEFVRYVADIVGDMLNKTWELSEQLKEITGETNLLKDVLALVKGEFDLIAGTFELILSLVKQIRDIFTSDFWEKGLDFGKLFDLSPWQSGGNNSPRGNQYAQSGGMMSGSITLNNTFSITSNNVTDAMVKGWANILTEQINENLGRMI